jgi:ABC-type Na+ efflux pump permease subunit
MSFLITSLKKDLARWRHDIIAILIWIFIPLMIGGLITVLMGSAGARPHGVLLLVDEDDTLLSALVAGAYTAGELGDLISVETTTLEAGTQRIDAGEASGLLVIPAGFAAAFVDAEPVTLTLKTNPSQTILPEVITSVTEILLDAGFYVRELFADEIGRLHESGIEAGDALFADLAISVRSKLESLAPRLLPPAIDVQIVEPEAEAPSPPLALLFMPGIIVMAVLFAANGLAGDFWRERAQGTLRRLVFAPARLGGFIAGKALAAAVVIAFVGGLTLVLGFLYHGLAWIKLPFALLWIVVSGVALFAWFATLQMLFNTQRAANLVSSMLLFPLLMAGGSFFPLAVMPGWMAAIGRASPNGFVADRLTDQIAGTGAGLIGPDGWLTVLAAALAGLLVCSWRLSSGFARA